MVIKPYQKITFIYFIVGAMWIFFSDRILTSLAGESTEILITFQTYKGWFFILLTSLLLFLLIRKDYHSIVQREKEKTDIFFTTMSAVHHILNNFLNKMFFFRNAAEESKEFAKDVLVEYDRVIVETAEQVKKLGDIDKVTKEEIEKTAYPNKQL